MTSEDDQSDLEDEEEDEDGEVERGKVEVTSMDEAMRTVSATPEPTQEAFLKQNFETLDDPSSMGKTTGNTHTHIRVTHQLQICIIHTIQRECVTPVGGLHIPKQSCFM